MKKLELPLHTYHVCVCVCVYRSYYFLQLSYSPRSLHLKFAFPNFLIMCTLEKRGNVYILTLTGTDDHRLHPDVVDSISAALRRIRSEIGATGTIPSALITTGEGKYFCNGGDTVWAHGNKKRFLFMLGKIRELMYEIMSLPMPTIAAINGHVAGGGIFFALSHDYVFMRKDRGFLYMSELDGAVVLAAPYMTVMVKAKISSPSVWRDIILKAEKMTATVAVEKGIVDAAYGSVEETVEAAVAFGEKLVERKWSGFAYAENRKILFKEVMHALSIAETEESVELSALAKDAKKIESRL